MKALHPLLRSILIGTALLGLAIFLALYWGKYLLSALVLFIFSGYCVSCSQKADGKFTKGLFTNGMTYAFVFALVLLFTSLYTSCIRSDTPEEKAAKRAEKLAHDPNWKQIGEQIQEQELLMKNSPQLSKAELEIENRKLDHLKAQKDFYESQGEFNPSHGYIKVAVETTLKKVMNNPSSLKELQCSDAKSFGKAWKVDCTFEGTNAYGGIVTETGTFLIFKNYLAVPAD